MTSVRQVRRLGAFVAVALTGSIVTAAAQVRPPAACGSPPNQTICLGEIDAPARFVGKIAEGGTRAIDAVMSDRLIAELEEFQQTHGAAGRHATAWRGVDARASVGAMRRHVGGIAITTYGGPIAWLKYVFAGNNAYEPIGDGPIRLNRAALPRSAASIANTIAHELAHKAGSGTPRAAMIWPPPIASRPM